MKYMLTLWNDETRWEGLAPEEAAAWMAEYARFGEEAGDVIVGGDGLEPTSAATTVRVRDGERLLTDGPFAETREQLGGFYILECASLDEALGWAAKVPDAGTGSVEVRPVLDYSKFEAEASESSATA